MTSPLLVLSTFALALVTVATPYAHAYSRPHTTPFSTPRLVTDSDPDHVSDKVGAVIGAIADNWIKPAMAGSEHIFDSCNVAIRSVFTP